MDPPHAPVSPSPQKDKTQLTYQRRRKKPSDSSAQEAAPSVHPPADTADSVLHTQEAVEDVPPQDTDQAIEEVEPVAVETAIIETEPGPEPETRMDVDELIGEDDLGPAPERGAGKRPMEEAVEQPQEKRQRKKKARALFQEPESPPPEIQEPQAEDYETEPEGGQKPKRVRKKVPPLILSSGSGYDQTRFVDDEAYAYYLDMAGRDIILDRGFSEQDMENPFVVDAIKSRGWEKFIRHHDGMYSWELTRVFTANLGYDKKGYKSWVDGVEVPYGPKVLNEFFEVVPVPVDEDFFGFVAPANLENCRLVVASMFEKQQKIAHYSRAIGKKVDGRKMDGPHYQWLQLYRSKIEPTDHTSGPSAHDLYVPYCIKTGRPVDIGSLIANNLYGRRTSKHKLAFPCLIWQLCKHAGVDLEKFPRDLKMRQAIPFKVMVLPGAPSAPLSLFIEPDTDMPPAEDATTERTVPQSRRPVHDTPSSHEDTSTGNLTLEVHRLREEVAGLKKLIEEQRRLDQEKTEQLLRRIDIQEARNQRIERLLQQLVGRNAPTASPDVNPAVASSESSEEEDRDGNE